MGSLPPQLYLQISYCLCPQQILPIAPFSPPSTPFSARQRPALTDGGHSPTGSSYRGPVLSWMKTTPSSRVFQEFPFPIPISPAPFFTTMLSILPRCTKQPQEQIRLENALSIERQKIKIKPILAANSSPIPYSLFTE